MTLSTTDNRDMTAAHDTDRARRVLAKLNDDFLCRVASGTALRATQCRWELDRRDHETRRARLLSPAHRNPIAAADIRPGQVISQGRRMRALVRDTYRLPLSGRVLLAVSYLDLVTGAPEDETRELLATDDPSLHLVTSDLAVVAPYAAPMPEVNR